MAFLKSFFLALSLPGFLGAAAVYDVGANTSFASFGDAFSQVALDAPGLGASVTISVRVYGGATPFNEVVQPPVIPNPLEIVAVAGNPLIASGGSYGIRVSGVANVRIEGMAIQGSNLAGILLENAPGAVLLLNRLSNNGGAEIQLAGSPGALISDNFLKPSAGSGLVLQNSPGAVLRSNSISKFSASSFSSGITCSDSPSCLVTYNAVDGALTGLGIYSSSGVSVTANTVFCRTGSFGSIGLYFSNSPGSSARNNLLVGQPKGVEVQNSNFCALWNNTVWEHGTAGVRVTNSMNVDMRNNLIQGDTALGVDSGSQPTLLSDYNGLDWIYQVAPGQASLADWQSTGKDASSITANAGFFLNPTGSAPDSFKLAGGSGAELSGADLSAQFALDYFQNQRTAAWDIGFHEISGIDATPTSSMTVTPVLPTPTATPTASPTPTQTQTPMPPSSPTPTFTPSPTFSVTATFTPTAYPVKKDRLVSYPNPYDPGKGAPLNLVFDPADEASLKVFDMAGGLVAEIPAGSILPRQGYAAWDGRSQDGRPIPAGLYFAVLRSEKGNRFTKFTVIYR